MDDERKTKAQLIAELEALRGRVAAMRARVANPLFSEDSAARYRDILQRVGAILTESDSGGRFVYVSSAVRPLLGYAPGELLGRPFDHWVDALDRAVVHEALQRLRRPGDAVKLVHRARCKEGRRVWLELHASAQPGRDGGITVVSFWRDVTEVQEAEAALRDSEDRFRAMAENASDLMAEVDADGRFLFVSPNCEALLGKPAEQLLGRTVADPVVAENIHPDDRQKLIDTYKRHVVNGPGGSVAYRFRRGDDGWRWFESRAASYRRSDGQRRAVMISRDVTEREEALRSFRESEKRYRMVADASLDLVTETDALGRFTYASAACYDVLGYTPAELIGTRYWDLLHEDDRPAYREALEEGDRSGRPVRIPAHRLRRRDGSWVWVEATCVFYRDADGERRRIGVARDLTARIEAERERRELEQRMQQAQKLEGLGVMAGGIAHDFNNLLTPILGDASLALLDLPPESPIRPRLQKIQRAAHRAAALTDQMLTYAGEEVLHVESVDLSRAVEEMAQLLETAASREVLKSFVLPHDLPRIEADPAQLSQVIMNLITNASEALADGKGHIGVRTGVLEVDRERLTRAYLGEGLEPGTYVYFEVADTGSGMDATTLSRIFDPFFTTKFTGRGLGLAAVLGIVRGHRGAIEIESTPGVGTSFRVLFPGSGRAAIAHAAGSRPAASWRGSGTVLVVDDDEGVRAFATDTLERAGLKVLTAADGPEGIALFRAHADEIVAVLLDRTMPGLGGEETFAELRRIRPDAGIILVSGYSEERASQRLADRGLSGFLHKPFVPVELLDQVRRLIEGRPAAAS